MSWTRLEKKRLKEIAEYDSGYDLAGRLAKRLNEMNEEDPEQLLDLGQVACLISDELSFVRKRIHALDEEVKNMMRVRDARKKAGRKPVNEKEAN